ncbi:sucrose-6-phosphate hydrolase-like [Helicoverpa zea]|uniref:sucrose-6-phosphate hydrolase-like n=1 Tax=Helicoverpa zea TaxID=7113 RepID=UPI001F56A081|nr:sucrose-6-phosphate hydrolase-like [Helicoverpa zea]
MIKATMKIIYSYRRAHRSQCFQKIMSIATKFILTALFLNRCWAGDVNPRYVPYYHVYPPSGWMNDPNGFCIFQGEYHLFYQYNPYTSQEPGVAHWGHVRSPNLIHWEHLPTAMTPDQAYDINGVFSGSAIVENGTMYLLYTGNVNNPTNKQVQALAASQDGISVVKYPGNPVIEGADLQPNIRDPKVWKHGDLFFMVLGNSFDDNTRGRVLLYSSPDLISWTMESVLDESDGSLGNVWECPDFFELDGKYVLLFSPQGMQPIGDKYKNLFQTGYLVGNFDYETKLFTPITEFRELDHGHDFYATQTILDHSGRRIVVAWFDMWESVHPERNDGWSGQITIPRELELTEGLRLLQKPVKEIASARGAKLRYGKARARYTLSLEAAAADVTVTAPRLQDFELLLESKDSTLSIKYDYKKGTVTLDRGGDDGVRRTKWRPEGNLVWQVLIDSSSVELFCGEGEVTFSSRFFPNGGLKIRIGDGSHADDLTVYEMIRTIQAPVDN